MSNDQQPQASRPPRRPYQPPRLRVFGSVAALTATLSMGGSAMDGGPNNSKSA